MQTRRLLYLDIAKGIAMICVILGHVLIWDLYGNEHYRSSLLMSFVCSFHVPLFFFVSGIVSLTVIHGEKRKKELKYIANDIYKRFRLLVIPALCIGIPYTIMSGHTVQEFFMDTWKWGYWYLFVLFEFYFVCYFYALLEKRLSQRTMIFLYLCLIPISIVVGRHLYLVSTTINDLFCISKFVEFLPYFMLGNFVKRYNLHNRFFNRKVFAVSLVIWIASPELLSHYANFLTEYSNTGNGGGRLRLLQNIGELFSLVSVAFITICIVSACRIFSEKQSVKLLAFIGRNTLYIYIFHYFVTHWVKRLSMYNWYSNYGNLPLDIVAGLLITSIAIAFSLIAKRILELSPWLMKSVFYKKG